MLINTITMRRNNSADNWLEVIGETGILDDGQCEKMCSIHNRWTHKIYASFFFLFHVLINTVK